MVFLPRAAGGGVVPRNTRLYSNWGPRPPVGPPPLYRYYEDRIVTLGEMSSHAADAMFEVRHLVTPFVGEAVAQDMADRVSDIVVDARDLGRDRLEREQQ